MLNDMDGVIGGGHTLRASCLLFDRERERNYLLKCLGGWFGY
jgi:hypothetical protein